MVTLGARETKSIRIKTIKYPSSKTQGGWSPNVHLSRCSSAYNQELWRSAFDLYCSGRRYFWKVLVYHRQTSKYALSNEICFKFLNQLIKKIWPGRICCFFADDPIFSEFPAEETGIRAQIGAIILKPLLSNLPSTPFTQDATCCWLGCTIHP